MPKGRRASLLEAAGRAPFSAVTPPALATETAPLEVEGPRPSPQVKEAPKAVQPSRVGKKPATTYISPEAKKQLLHLKTDLDIDLEDLLREGINLIFEKYNKPPIA